MPEEPTGELLGQWKDELDGHKIVGTFVSLGPKEYSYQSTDPKKDSPTMFFFS